jgi:hypothetical protein
VDQRLTPDRHDEAGINRLCLLKPDLGEGVFEQVQQLHPLDEVRLRRGGFVAVGNSILPNTRAAGSASSSWLSPSWARVTVALRDIQAASATRNCFIDWHTLQRPASAGPVPITCTLPG